MVDPGWKSFGASSEIITSVVEECFSYLKTSPIRINYPDSHIPMSHKLEKYFYFNDKSISKDILNLM